MLGDIWRVRAALLLASGFALLTCAALAPSALASGKPLTIGTPYASGPPSVAVESTGEGLVAWANTKDLAGANNYVQYCVVVPGATGCSHSGNLMPADSAQYIDGVTALVDGGTMIIVADVFGAAGNSAQDYEPVQEWQSTDGGATWTPVNGGLSVTSGILSADTVPVGAVILPGTGVLGYGWDTASDVPTFNAFPLSAPPECSRQTCPPGFAKLEPATNPDVLSNAPGQFAAEAGANPGAMGIFDTLFTNGPLGCPTQTSGFGTAYVYGSGNQSAGNSYNIPPGQPNSAWKVPLTQADCNTEYSAVGGGPSGFGILEDALGTSTVVYHSFDAATAKFDTPLVTVNGSGGEIDGAVSQDGAGGIYTTYLLGGPGGPLTLSYSGDGGKTFSSGPLNTNSDSGISQAGSAVGGAGQGWAVWTDNGSVLAQPFQAADAITPASVGGSASTSGSTVTIDVTCTSFPCTVTVTLTAPETVVVHASRAARATTARKHKTKIVTLGKATVTLTSKQTHKLAVKLSRPGRAFVKAKHGHVRISASLTETVERISKVTNRVLTLTIHHPAKRKK
jgi:hypothetical protein